MHLLAQFLILWRMKLKNLILILMVAIFATSCNSYQHIYDDASRKRQKQIQGERSANVTGDILMIFGSAVLESATGVVTEYYPEGQTFKRLNFKNPTKDTLFVNMVTDVSWDNENYLDFMDIRIPPQDNCRLLLPIGINYNVYFGNTNNPENDELIEINTGLKRRFVLKPGMTMPADSIFAD